jgi:outer membrane protein
MKILIGLFLTLSLPALSLSQNIKMAYVNSEEIMLLFTEVIDLERNLEQDYKNWEKEVGQKQTQIDQLKKELAEQQLMLSKDEISDREKKIAEQEKELQSYVDDVWGKEGKASSQNKTLFKPLYDKIMDAIRQVAQRDGYTYVFDVAEAGLVFAPLEDDITKDVIAVLNQQIESEKTIEERNREEQDKGNVPPQDVDPNRNQNP